MEVIGIKLQKAVLMMMSMVSMLGVSSCEDRLDSPRPSTGGDKTVEVSLCVGIADEVDAVSLSAGSSGTRAMGVGDNQAFDVRLSPAAARTKADALDNTSVDALASAKPDQLYNLQILQYDSNNNFKALTTTVSQATGSTLTVGLTPCENCQLIIVARGSSNAIPVFSGSPSWSDLQGRLANASTINGIGDGGINAMPYFIHLKNVNVTENGTIIQSATDNDARILLRRLAVRLTVDWKLAEGLRTGYTLKEVKLCQVPTIYYLMSPTETDSRFEGDLYPISTVEYKDLYRLKGDDAKNEGSLTTWMPANAKGRSRNVTSEYYRTKEYAHTSATYMEFVVDNKDGLERMYYRAYLGGKDVSDFNLLENTNYHYTINIRNTDYRGDPRIRLLDQTPVISTNLVSTSNCFMMRPGTNICFNPYLHEAGTNGWNTYLTSTAGAINNGKTIGSVRVLWQSKDAGTSGDLVMGYAVNDESNNYNHTNLVNYENLSDPATARVHVKVPVTNGGNAVIAAYAQDGKTILWSWHLWITDYVPALLTAPVSTSDSDATRQNAIRLAQSACAAGTVHQYGGTAWKSGAFYNKVIMDRNLGALRNTYNLQNPLEAARAYGNLYQWSRKDPQPGSADGGSSDMDLMFDANGYSITYVVLPKPTVDHQEVAIQHPNTFYIDLELSNWGTAKTVHDPCPAGWRVPDFSDSNNIYSEIKENTANKSYRYMVAKQILSQHIDGNSIGEKHFDISNGFLYTNPMGDPVWFPAARLREPGTGLLRDPWRGPGSTTIPFNKDYLPSSIYWASTNVYAETKPTMTYFHIGGLRRAFALSIRCVQDR